MNIEDYKHLSVPVGERLPEEQGDYITIVKGNYVVQYFTKIGKSIHWACEETTHYLDLSILTTKAKALELAEKAFDAGMEREYQGHFGSVPNKALSLGEFKEKFKNILQ